jgi:DNA-damage-inducible protein D
MNKEIEPTTGGHLSPFERIKRTNDAGMEFWSSRDFAEVLGYGDYRNFEGVVEKAKLSCFNSGHRLEDHFVDVTEMIEIGKGGQRPVKTVLLSRYACYLAIQNADPKKEIVAQGQTYFAVQTRRQELADERVEEERRILLREEMRRHNVQLADAAKGAGVIEPLDYAIFQNHGYMGLYGGLKMEDIHRRKNLKKSQKILDHMGSTELAANLFRATQAEDKLRRERVRGKVAAYQTHHEVGAKVRQTIRELGGTMPENLPTAESIKKIETQKRKQIGSTNVPEKKGKR